MLVDNENDDITALYQILADVTRVYRNGPEFNERVRADGVVVNELVGYPAIPDNLADLDGRLLVDCHFVTVAVAIEKAEAVRADIVTAVMKQREMFADGPSYITVGAWLNDQQTAFQFMALGEAIGLWLVLTPAKLGFPPEIRDQAAGMGYVMITPFPKIPAYSGNVSHGRAFAGSPVSVTCPHCGARHAAQFVDETAQELDDGDVSICIACGEIAVADLKAEGGLRKPDGMERENILSSPDIMHALAIWADMNRRRNNALPN